MGSVIAKYGFFLQKIPFLLQKSETRGTLTPSWCEQL